MSKEIREFTTYMDALGVGWEWSGLCVWLDEEASRYGDQLQTLGCRWSVKRQAWYLRYNGGM